VKGTNLHKFLN